MGFRLIVAEKPSVARDIARALKVGGAARRKGHIGDGPLKVSWCVGHLVELAEPQAYDPSWKSWRLETLPMIPERFELRPRQGASDQWKHLRELLRDPDLSEVVNACDAGREGELIFAFVYELARCTAPVRRLWISSMTDAAIRQGFASLRPGETMADLEAAARCRAEADWLVGLNSTRAMTVKLREGGRSLLLSVGRVQTPTLALIDERERAIEEFEPQTFWQVKARLSRRDGAAPPETWEALWTGRDDAGKPTDRLFDQEAARAVIDRVTGRDGTVTKVERKKKRERPPLLYDLTALQKEANKRFAFSAKRTLDLAQALYENHKVTTYPRTDSRHLGSDQVDGLPALLESLRFGPYEATADQLLARGPIRPGKRVVNDAEVSDHHAIIPTGVDPRPLGLSKDEKRIFDLVARRFLAAFCDDAVFATAAIETTVEGEPFLAKGRTLLEPGWRAIDPPAKKKGKNKDKEAQDLPTVEVGEGVDLVEAMLHEGTTKPPPRYSEATLLGAMERAGEGLDDAELERAMKRKGLGTPATRAAIIETLLSRGYIERERGGKMLLPTAQGRALLRALPVEALRSARLTGEWEARLANVADGAEPREAFMRDIKAFVREAVDQIVRAEVSREVRDAVAADGGRAADSALLGPCPRCGGEVRGARWGWACAGCSFQIPGQVARRPLSERQAKQLLTTGATPPVKGFKSKKGKAFRAGLRLDAEGRVVFDFPAPGALGDCPACGKPVRRRGRFYTCDSGRECPFIVPLVFHGVDVDAAAIKALLTEGRTPTFTELVRERDGVASEVAPRITGHFAVGDGGRVRLVESDPREDAGPAGACPRCGAHVSFSRGRWRCESCSLSVAGTVASRELRAPEVADLLRRGRTSRLYGFRQRSGATFKAALVLDPATGRVELDFEASDEGPEPVPPGGPRPAFGQRTDCPICLAQAIPDPGYVVAGREAWGCSRWREGCPLRVPFEVHGTRIPDEEAARLFSRQKATRYLEEPIGEPGKRKICRVVLKVDEQPCWVLEPRKSRRKR